MFENVYKKLYKSRKTVSTKEAKTYKKKIKDLKASIEKRTEQISKYKKLIKEDTSRKDRYHQRIKVHEQYIDKENKLIKEIEFILLDS